MKEGREGEWRGIGGEREEGKKMERKENKLFFRIINVLLMSLGMFLFV